MPMFRKGLLAAVALLAAGCASSQKVDGPAHRPVLLIVGDSISRPGIGYFHPVAEKLGERFEVLHNPGNAGDSENTLAHIEDWILRARPDVIHLNCGLHDLKLDRQTGGHQVEPDQYEANLNAIMDRIAATTDARVVFALTTPVNEQWHHERKPFDRRQADVKRYNAIAKRVMGTRGIPINDLYTVVANAGPDTCLVADGVHMNDRGNALLSDAVAAFLSK